MEKIPAIVFFRPKLDSFFNLENAEELITLEYGGKFFYPSIVEYLKEMSAQYVSFMKPMRQIHSSIDLEGLS